MPHVLCLIIHGINHHNAYSMEPVFIIPSIIRHNTCGMDYVNAVPGLLSGVQNSPPPWPNLRPFRPHLPKLFNFLVRRSPHNVQEKPPCTGEATSITAAFAVSVAWLISVFVLLISFILIHDATSSRRPQAVAPLSLSSCRPHAKPSIVIAPSSRVAHPRVALKPSRL